MSAFRGVSAGETYHLLIEYAKIVRARDDLVRAAVAAGLSKYRIHKISGIARSTIDRILETEEAA